MNYLKDVTLQEWIAIGILTYIGVAIVVASLAGRLFRTSTNPEDEEA